RKGRRRGDRAGQAAPGPGAARRHQGPAWHEGLPPGPDLPPLGHAGERGGGERDRGYFFSCLRSSAAFLWHSWVSASGSGGGGVGRAGGGVGEGAGEMKASARLMRFSAS